MRGGASAAMLFRLRDGSILLPPPGDCKRNKSKVVWGLIAAECGSIISFSSYLWRERSEIISGK
ncbi:hypothetical protein ATZ36_04440 [Candidatus Endomicrobiellum trichonymphae]|uniref:Uncharacterized protein n=1 Tax=Endomicrobium trichonymphae TaxID=1408204 RepID=A0A1E5IIV5_ENDTX|nr:hypothetical protein ATZ36_04440 [Candidatus Endomicrobium trichonymphae]